MITQTVVRIKTAVGFADNDLIAVIQSEFLVVMGINKTNSTLCLFKMMVKPILLVAVAVKIVVTLIWVKTHKKGVVLRVHPYTIIYACAVCEYIVAVNTKIFKLITVGKKTAVLS